jgi:hypothetical protein
LEYARDHFFDKCLQRSLVTGAYERWLQVVGVELLLEDRRVEGDNVIDEQLDVVC